VKIEHELQQYRTEEDHEGLVIRYISSIYINAHQLNSNLCLLHISVDLDRGPCVALCIIDTKFMGSIDILEDLSSKTWPDLS
jgi:hypothetical protein